MVCDADVDEHMVFAQSLFAAPTSGQRSCCRFLRGCGLPALAQATARVDVPTATFCSAVLGDWFARFCVGERLHGRVENDLHDELAEIR